jgi:exopolyphosphatase/guanosine-5'-triphosphate,3'-diphosphate pyrophosphatase
VGTNTVKALAAEAGRGGFRVLADRSWGTRLGEGLRAGGPLGEGPVERTLAAVAEARAAFARLEVSEWRAVGTSAAREASNGAGFARRFREEAGFGLTVLDGEEEAELAFLAAAGDPRIVPRGKGALVMNSGGGSAEWASGRDLRAERRASRPLGCVRMTERFLRGDPYTPGSLRRLAAHYAEALAPIARDFPLRGRVFVGTGGSICAVAAMAAGGERFRAEEVHGRVLSAEEVGAAAAKLAAMTARARRKIPSLPAQRADIVAAGALLFAAAMGALGAARVVVSARGLRYGVLLEMLGASGRTRRR